MTLPFALRSRIRLRDEPERTRAVRVSPLALPVAAYWGIMGLLTYGVASGALGPERLAALRILPEGTFASSHVSDESVAPATGTDDEPVNPPRVVESAGPPLAATTQEPSAPMVAIAPPADTAAPAPTTQRDTSASPMLASGAAPPAAGIATALRPLAGFSLGAPYEDDDGDRNSYAAVARRDRDEVFGDEPRGGEAHAARVARRDDDAPRPRPAPRDPMLDREWNVPVPSEFRPAARGSVAMHAPEAHARRGPQRHDAVDPYPGLPDDDFTPQVPRDRTRDTRDEAPERQPVGRLPTPAAASVGSCEAVLATASEEMDLTKASGAPDLTRGAYASVLERGGYLLPCGVPEGMSLDVCAAIRDGHAVGITVVTHPGDARVRTCVRNAVAAIAFPRSPRLDVTRTRFDPGRRR